jgi:hypothetical protein
LSLPLVAQLLPNHSQYVIERGQLGVDEKTIRNDISENSELKDKRSGKGTRGSKGKSENSDKPPPMLSL